MPYKIYSNLDFGYENIEVKSRYMYTSVYVSRNLCQSYDFSIYNCNDSVVGRRIERFSMQKKILLFSKRTGIPVAL
jgi:hypothetical protein